MDTVNDSHMIASGVPDKNGDRHASIIASMSLDVMVRRYCYRCHIHIIVLFNINVHIQLKIYTKFKTTSTDFSTENKQNMFELYFQAARIKSALDLKRILPQILQ